jgi:hypothetical protein
MADQSVRPPPFCEAITKGFTAIRGKYSGTFYGSKLVHDMKHCYRRRAFNGTFVTLLRASSWSQRERTKGSNRQVQGIQIDDIQPLHRGSFLEAASRDLSPTSFRSYGQVPEWNKVPIPNHNSKSRVKFCGEG